MKLELLQVSFSFTYILLKRIILKTFFIRKGAFFYFMKLVYIQSCIPMRLLFKEYKNTVDTCTAQLQQLEN